MGVHPPQNGGIGCDPRPNGYWFFASEKTEHPYPSRQLTQPASMAGASHRFQDELNVTQLDTKSLLDIAPLNSYALLNKCGTSRNPLPQLEVLLPEV